jgi:hypothetical protein
MLQLGSERTWFSSRESRLMVGRYPGEDAFLGSREVGNCAQHRFSSCQGCSPSSSSPGDVTCFEETIRTLFPTLSELA